MSAKLDSDSPNRTPGTDVIVGGSDISTLISGRWLTGEVSKQCTGLAAVNHACSICAGHRRTVSCVCVAAAKKVLRLSR